MSARRASNPPDAVRAPAGQLHEAEPDRCGNTGSLGARIRLAPPDGGMHDRTAAEVGCRRLHAEVAERPWHHPERRRAIENPEEAAPSAAPLPDSFFYRLVAVLILACGAAALAVWLAIPLQDGPLMINIFG